MSLKKYQFLSISERLTSTPQMIMPTDATRNDAPDAVLRFAWLTVGCELLVSLQV